MELMHNYFEISKERLENTVNSITKKGETEK